MLIAGEPSGDLLASELVLALRAQLPDAKFFGAGGAKMAAAGVELAFDMTQHAVVGLPTMGKYLALRRLFQKVLALAIDRQPDVIIGVDYGGFNLRFGHAVKKYVRTHPGGWNPKLVQFVSPQVWASRPWRAKQLAADYDLLLSIFPFEKDWYARRVPQLRVDFVGHPMLDRIRKAESGKRKAEKEAVILLLPGSRKSELRNHLPVMLGAWNYIQGQLPGVRAKMVLPSEQLRGLAAAAEGAGVEIHIGNVPEALAQADLAITKTGTVTMECAFFGVPAVTIYKKSLLGLAIDLGVITVKSLTMPNLMAGETVYPEFLAEAATPENVAIAALQLLRDEPRRQQIKAQLADIVASLGEPGASRRAATAVLSL
jgi:lipid-A-disaccharide synthase